MDKPIMFFSHSSQDQKSLVRLKELFLEKTGESIEIFLSCDGQSIPLGRNWVRRVQEALEEAKVMVTFVTPNAIRSNWLYFESGFAYAKGIRVVPVGFLGLDLATITPPLSLLQGFNITSADGLDNLVALANEVFQHSHLSRFTMDEYQQVVAHGGFLSESALGEYSAAINEIVIDLEKATGLTCTPSDTLSRIGEVLKQHEVQYESADKTLTFHGVCISTAYQELIRIQIDPLIAAFTFPLVEEAIKSIRTKGIYGLKLIFKFLRSVLNLGGRHKVSARLYGSQVSFGKSNTFVFKDP